MPTVSDLGQRVKTKYPGAYDDLPDDELGRRVKTKYPGSYDDFTEQLTQAQAGAEISRLASPKPITSTPPRPVQDPLASSQLFNRSDSLPAPIPGTERLGGAPPPIAPVRAPAGLTEDNEPAPAAFRIAEALKPRFAGAPSVDEKYNRIKGNVSQALSGAASLIPSSRMTGTPEEIQASAEATRRDYSFPRSASRAIEGTLGLMSEPEIMGPLAALAPVPAAAAIATGMVAQPLAERGFLAMGASEDWSRFGGDIAGLAAGGWGAKAVSPLGLHPNLNGRTFRPPSILDTPAAKTTTFPEAFPPVPAPIVRPLGNDARMHQEVQLGAGAEAIPERLMGQTPLQRARERGSLSVRSREPGQASSMWGSCLPKEESAEVRTTTQSPVGLGFNRSRIL
ncbi:MAG TPA: hypothetical protein VFE22_15705 [Edaphobacter sp.]|nr:hypothetical protein [Edaphobacter sp.]